MAKPTTETIDLPNFPVTVVRKLAGNFIHDDISLQEMVANTDKGLILYFYPKDNTPGCTTQATEFTSHLHDFDDLGYDIIGVSRDSVDSHEKFIDKYDRYTQHQDPPCWPPKSYRFFCSRRYVIDHS